MFAIIDLETTGLDPGTDRIFEIAILQFDGQQLTDSFCTLVNPEFQLLPGIERLTGIVDKQLSDAPKFFQIARKIVELTENRIIVAHHSRFDYAFLRKEFSRLGYNFSRQQLCTERLSRKLLPDFGSYKLSHLCKKLNIPLNGAHRALADANATLQLFQHLQILEKCPVSETESLKENIRENILPPGLNRNDINKLAEGCGVYFFYDERDRLIYVGKSKNIRKRVQSHFSGDLKSQKSLKMKHHIRRIDYQITGSELIALLLESDLIKTHQPVFNRSQRTIRYRYGLFSQLSADGYLTFSLQRFGPKGPNGIDGELVIAFSNKKQAQSFQDRIITKYRLCQKLCGLYKNRGPCFNYHLKLCNGACVGSESPEDYNLRANQAIDQFCYDFPDFLIVTKGRNADEKGVVLIRQGLYRGFGFLPEDAISALAIDTVGEHIQQRADNQDIRKIINAFLAKHPKTRIIALDK